MMWMWHVVDKSAGYFDCADGCDAADQWQKAEAALVEIEAANGCGLYKPGLAAERSPNGDRESLRFASGGSFSVNP
jgi:hypothetical protein